MENGKKPYTVYAMIDDDSRILAINSDAFLFPTDLWIAIDSGYDDKCHYADEQYLDKPLMDERGVCRYKLADGVVQERTQEEMDAETVPPAPVMTVEEQIAELKAELESYAAAYEAAYQEGVQGA